ncbi:MAG: hypothetical protein ACRDOL_44550 [Streptosporangiaceae bacterium]
MPEFSITRTPIKGEVEVAGDTYWAKNTAALVEEPAAGHAAR